MEGPGTRGPCHAPTTGSERGQADQSRDVPCLPYRKQAGNTETGCKVAAREIGGYSRRLIEQEQEGQRKRRIAEAEKVKQHQHAQGAVDQRKPPIGGSDDKIDACHCCHSPPSSTIFSSATIQQA